MSVSASDLFHGEEPEEHGGGEQTYRGEERGLVPGAIRSESGPDPQPGQHPLASHGEYIQCLLHCFKRGHTRRKYFRLTDRIISLA